MLVLLVLLGWLALFQASSARATFPLPGGGGHTNLGYWPFSDTNWLSYSGHAPASVTNLINVPEAGNHNCLLLDSTNAAWLRYRVVEGDGTTNLTVREGSATWWFSPSWSGTNEGGAGPGCWGRLLEIGAYTTNAAYGWWSVYLDPEGANIYFSAQTNDGSGATYFSAPISWTSNRWHMITLTYSTVTNCALYVDGDLVTNGPAITYLPGPDVLTNGFTVGSDAETGLAQARGMFDDLHTYNYQVQPGLIKVTFELLDLIYNGASTNEPSIAPGSSSPSFNPIFQAVTGPGYLTAVSTNGAGCITSSNIWITNVVAAIASNGTVGVTFSIAGGYDGQLYDVFANSVPASASDTNRPWGWMGQGYHCSRYTLTNLPPTSAFVTLGGPQDADEDGLTDSYERLVSKTRADLSDTDGDGMIDGWEVVLGRNPLISGAAADLSGSLHFQVHTPLR